MAKKQTSQVTGGEVKAIQKVQPGALAPWMQEAMEEANADAAKFQQGLSRITFDVQGPMIDGEYAKDKKLPVVIVEAIFGKAYYPAAYNPKAPATPTCYAFHPDDQAKMVPHEACPDKQAEACKGCPHNVFGTALVGAGKRCKDEIRLMCAVYKPDEDFVRGEFRMASVPPASLKGWGTYVKQLRDMGQTFRTVVTELSTEPLGGGFKVTFHATGQIEEAQYKAFKERRASAREEMMQPYPVLEETAPATPPPAKGKRKF